MPRMTKILTIGALALGVAALTVYASNALNASETTAAKTTPVVVTSGGSGSCCASGEAKQTKAENALFTPKAQTAAQTQGTCPVTGKTAAKQAAAGSACPADKTAMAAAMATGKTCDATAKTAAKTVSNDACPPGDACTQPKICPETTAIKTATAPTAQGDCCANEAAKTKAATKAKAKVLMAGTVPAAKTAN